MGKSYYPSGVKIFTRGVRWGKKCTPSYPSCIFVKAITYSREKNKVAIIDSGVDFTADIDVVRKNFIPEEEDVSIIYEDTCGHGTSVAGIIAAKDNDEGITGINPNVELYSAKVLDSNCMAPVDRVVDAIYWAMEQGVDIINISFGTATDNQALKQAIEDAYHAGILLVAAAGNHDVVEYPAAYEEVIAVGSVDTQGERSEGSAVGEALELVAPGEQILSTGDFGGLSVSSGTSMSALHVTGVASVLWQKDTSVSADFIRQLLAYSANLYGAQDEYGYGLIDLNYALSIYDEFKEIYNSNTASTFAMVEAVEETEELPVIEENQSEVIVFDVDYVVGSWKTAEHETLVENAEGSVHTLLASQIQAMKFGARANDIYVLHMTIHPGFHGYYKYTGKVDKDGILIKDTIYSGDKYVNYFNCYKYLTELAISVSNGYYSISPSYMSTLEKNLMFGYNNGTYCYAKFSSEGLYNSVGLERNGTGYPDSNTWEKMLGKKYNSSSNRKFFIYGMALHTATDLFAHSTFVNGTHIPHDPFEYDNKKYKNAADNTECCLNRYACAQEVALNVINRCVKQQVGDVDDFICTSYDYSFKIANFREYAKETNWSIYWKNQYEFDKMTISK